MRRRGRRIHLTEVEAVAASRSWCGAWQAYDSRDTY